MKQFIKPLYIIFLSLLFISCKKNLVENCSVDSIINEYNITTNKEFIFKYKNKKVVLNGTVGFYSQNKERPGKEYYVIFDSPNIDYDFLTGTYVSCVLCAERKIEIGDKISVICSFDKLYKSLENDNIGFKKGKIIQ